MIHNDDDTVTMTVDEYNELLWAIEDAKTDADAWAMGDDW